MITSSRIDEARGLLDMAQKDGHIRPDGQRVYLPAAEVQRGVHCPWMAQRARNGHCHRGVCGTDAGLTK